MNVVVENQSALYKEAPFIQTYTGKRFSLHEPEFDIEDIAHALSMLCRFNGHVTHFYSVANHSIMVASLMEEREWGNPLEGLLHDATEAYLSDVPSPYKTVLPDWQKFDDELDAKLRLLYNLPAEKSPGCRTADKVALVLEARELTADGGECFHGSENWDEFLESVGVKAWAWPLCSERGIKRDFIELFEEWS